MNPTDIYIYIYMCVCVCVLKRQIDGGCGGSESGGETLILIMKQILKFPFFS